MSQLAILGASGHGKVLACAAEAFGWCNIVFFDDAWPELVSNGPWEVIGTGSDLIAKAGSYAGVAVAIGDNATRKYKLDFLIAAGAAVVSVVHPSATISRYASIAAGGAVFAGAVVNAGASIGGGVILNTNSVVEHDCVLGSTCHLSPGAVLAGGVHLGNGVWVGANASIKQSVCVGDNSVVGMGAVVTRNVRPEVTVVGSPARLLKK